MNRSPSARTSDADDATNSQVTGSGVIDTAARWGNAVIWTLVALFATVLGVVLIPLHASGGFLIPVSPLIGLGANFLLPKMMLAGTGWAGTRFIPAAIWAVVAFIGSTPTGDGDVLISGSGHSSGVGLAYLGFGALGAVLGIVFAASPMRRPGARTGAED